MPTHGMSSRRSALTCHPEPFLPVIPSPSFLSSRALPSCHPERSEGSVPLSKEGTRFLVASLLGMTVRRVVIPSAARDLCPVEKGDQIPRRFAPRNDSRGCCPRTDIGQER